MAFTFNFVFIFFIFEIVLYIFHLSMLILMIAKRKKTFNGPFFDVFRTVLIADFFTFLIATFGSKITLIPFVMNYVLENTYTASFVLAFLGFVTIIQFFGHLFLSLNRFTIIWFPLIYKQIWKRQWYTVAILGISFLSISWRIHESAYFVFDSDKPPSIVYTNENVSKLLYIVSTVIYFSTTCFAAILNALTFVKFFMRKKNNTSALNVNESNLLAVSFVIFIAQLFRVSFNASKFLFPSNVELQNFFNSIYPVLNGLFALSGSITLFFLSSLTRKAYKTFYFCKSNIQNLNSTTQQRMFLTTKV